MEISSFLLTDMTSFDTGIYRGGDREFFFFFFPKKHDFLFFIFCNRASPKQVDIDFFSEGKLIGTLFMVVFASSNSGLSYIQTRCNLFIYLKLSKSLRSISTEFISPLLPLRIFYREKQRNCLWGGCLACELGRKMPFFTFLIDCLSFRVYCISCHCPCPPLVLA